MRHWLPAAWCLWEELGEVEQAGTTHTPEFCRMGSTCLGNHSLLWHIYWKKLSLPNRCWFLASMLGRLEKQLILKHSSLGLTFRAKVEHQTTSHWGTMGPREGGKGCTGHPHGALVALHLIWSCPSHSVIHRAPQMTSGWSVTKNHSLTKTSGRLLWVLVRSQSCPVLSLAYLDQAY